MNVIMKKKRSWIRKNYRYITIGRKHLDYEGIWRVNHHGIDDQAGLQIIIK